MNTMAVPGFTAEASLYNTRTSYRMVAGSTASTSNGLVEMSIGRNLLAHWCSSLTNDCLDGCNPYDNGCRFGCNDFFFDCLDAFTGGLFIP